MRLDDHVVLITGAGSGIGAAGAKHFASRGARVCLVDLQEDGIQEQAEKLRQLEGDVGEVMTQTANVLNEDEIEAAIEATVAEWGQLDVTWANAGIGGMNAPVDKIKAEEWDEVLEVNLRGTFLTIKHAVKHMKERRSGSIIVTSSTSGNRTFTDIGASPYSVSKAAQVSLVKCLAVELADHGIRINAICPGKTDTALGESDESRAEEELTEPLEHPEGNMPLEDDDELDPDDVALAAIFLTIASAVTATEIYADGGQGLVT